MVVTTIALPTRPQTDTIIAIYILKAYGGHLFGGIEHAQYEVISRIPEGKTEKDYLKEGTILIDVGGGIFDHHGKAEKTTASNLVAKALGVQEDPSIRKMLDVAERCDFYGKATISEDPLDRAFGIAGVISALNKTSSGVPEKVIEPMLTIFRAHHLIEKMRTEEMPKEVDTLKEKGLFSDSLLLQRKNKLKVCFTESDNTGLPGFLRATDGGKYDIVVQRRSTGHVNILTRPLKRPDLRQVSVLIRSREYELLHEGKKHPNPGAFRIGGKNEEVACWYFDPATNSLLNGAVNTAEITATAIPWGEFKELVIKGIETAQ